jgi:hypothetical protein
LEINVHQSKRKCSMNEEKTGPVELKMAGAENPADLNTGC